MTVQVHDTEKTLAELVDIAASGEEVVIVRDGKTTVRMKADAVKSDAAPEQLRRFGFLKEYGFKIPEDFNEMGREEIERDFYGEE